MASRSSRSRTPDTRTTTGGVTDVSASLNSDSRLTPNLTSPTPSPISPENTDLKPQKDTMISTVTQQAATPVEIPTPGNNNNMVNQSLNNVEADDDSRSSSLSELEDESDPRDAASADHMADHESDYDTEAETERLERTPQKLNVPLSNSLPDKSPSKLAQEVMADDDASTPTAHGHDIDIEDNHDTLAKVDSPSNMNGVESPSRKRKRPKSVASSTSDTDEPLAKRSQSARFQVASAESSTETLVHNEAQSAAEDDSVALAAEVPRPTEQDQEPEVHEPPVASKKFKGRRGKRKGKRAANDDVETNGDDAAAQEEQEAEEEEEDSNKDEEIAKKRLAIDAFTKIEKEFAAFREKHIKQQLQQITHELELLRQPSSTHPEYLSTLKCIDDYRDEKIRYQDTLFRFKHGALQVRTVSERQQLHSQYFQEVRESREKTLEVCYKNLYAIQKDRRRWGADEANYAHMYVPKRTQQIAQQQTYNLEVSILSGVAKHVGFPAAPKLPAIPAEDVDSDFKSMKIPDRPLQPRITLRDVERNAADTSFYEQNAWANPSIAHMVQTQPFATPSAPNRIVSNGSTIDVNLMSAQNSQHPTPQDDMQAVLGGYTKAPTALDSSPLAASAGPLPGVLNATAFSTRGLHGAEVKDTPHAPPLAMSSISVGGGNRFPQ